MRTTRQVLGSLTLVALFANALACSDIPNRATKTADTGAATQTDTGATTGQPDVATTDTGTPGPGADATATPEDVASDKLTITLVDPGVGSAKGGEVISVTGSKFVTGKTQVIIGKSQASQVFVVDSRRLTAITPPGVPGLVDVTVINPDPAPEKVEKATLALAFRYQSDVLVTSVEPASGLVAGGEPVTITGSGFSQGAPKLVFGGRAAIDPKVIDDGTIQATTPPSDDIGLVDVHLTNDRGSAVLKDAFLYHEPMAIDYVAPAAGPTAGGTEVTIVGHGFAPGIVVHFGGAQATKVEVKDSSRLIAVAPAGAAGAVTVAVESELGVAALPKGYIYTDSLPSGVQILSVLPSSGPIAGGTLVAIAAFGLGTKPDTQVRFGGETATLVSVDATKLIALVTAPPHAAGLVDVTVTSPAGAATAKNAFTYDALHKVLTVSPVSGPVAGGTPITIYGDGFASGADVRIGALQCGKVTVASPKQLSCTTPAGSPGAADVTVTQLGKAVILPKGFHYTSGGVELFVVDPSTGSQAGGTYVRLIGSGFEAPVKVTFAGTQATHTKVVSSTLVTVKTPPGPIGPVDVTLAAKSGTVTLPKSYTYFNPVSLFGGTWGPKVEGAVNVTVLDGGSGEPLPDAFVMLYVNPDTPYQGFTNVGGQITFSGPELAGKQMVSASKPEYASESVIAFNATNITIYLIPLKPPSPGPPPAGEAPIVSGTVTGLGKYVVVPPGDCKVKVPNAAAGTVCAKCKLDTECLGGGVCTTIGETGSFCTLGCKADVDCEKGYSCLSIGKLGAPQCVPTPGKKQARCFHTMPTIFSQPRPDWTQIPSHIADDAGLYSFSPSYLGEMAVVCLGGYVSWDNPDLFTPLAFGVRRHLNVAPGPNPADVALNHQLGRTVKVRLDAPPFDAKIGPEFIGALLYWDFGSDGAFVYDEFQDVLYGSSNDVMRIEHQPTAWAGDVFDATFSILGVAISFNDDGTQLPASFTLVRNLKDIDTDLAYTLDAGQWAANHSGVTKTVNTLWGFAQNDVWAVTDGGGILHYNGGWGMQASPVDTNLYGIWGTSPTDVWAVGAQGALLHFDGVTWKATTLPNATGAELRAIHGFGPKDIHVVSGGWAGAWHFDGTAWTKTTGIFGELRDVHGASSNDVWAVGSYGSIFRWDGKTWKNQAVAVANQKDLMSVFAVSASEVYIVGTQGTILAWDGAVWAAMKAPTTRSLRAVWAMGNKDVYAVGDGGVVLHFDGKAWQDQTLPGKVSESALLALWGEPTTGKAYALGSSEVLMGPMLQVPEQQDPADGGKMDGFHVAFQTKPGPAAHFHYLSVAIPGPFGDIPVWNITTAGDVFEFDLPDFANIQGTPGIDAGAYKLTIIRVYKDDFDIDNYDLSDFSNLDWRSWSIDTTFFTK